ncbi:MAG: DUF1501 domain-containing protein, partial [Chloroflexota bacterium]
MAAVDSAKKDPVLVVVQLNGGNDGLNTVIPYSNPLYHDSRPAIRLPEDDVLRLNDQVGFHPSMAPLKSFFDDGKLAIIQGIGYPNPDRSHFRSMDIWHTAEPDEMAEDGWLGKTMHDIDPKGENPLLGINVGRGLPRAFHLPNVSVASVASIDSYGVLTGMSATTQRASALDVLSRMYAAREGQAEAMFYIGQTGLDAQRGADVLRQSIKGYSSAVEYPQGNPLAGSLKAVAQMKLADLGTRVFYTQIGSFDTHANQAEVHAGLWTRTSEAIAAFYADLQAHNAEQDVILWVFSEFGRRVRDNGSGTDHGAGSMAFVIGDQVKGGLYGQYPSLRPERQVEGDLAHEVDFRSMYATILERWMRVDPEPIVGGTFEQFDLFK